MLVTALFLLKAYISSVNVYPRTTLTLSPKQDSFIKHSMVKRKVKMMLNACSQSM